MNITEYFPDYLEIGYTKKSYGVSGHLRVFIQDEQSETIEQAKHCFFLMKGCLVPYFIDQYEDGLVKFESCKNPEDARNLVSKTIYVHKDQVVEGQIKDVDPDSFQFVEGYRLVNSETEEVIGIIDEVVVYPQQEIATVGEHMIPLNIHNVKGINKAEQLIFVDIPEGLLDL